MVFYERRHPLCAHVFLANERVCISLYTILQQCHILMLFDRSHPSRCVICNVVVYYSVYKQNINYKMAKFSVNYMATCFGYILAILRPT